MTRETKVGLLVGMGVILLIGIIVSDTLSVAQRQDPAPLPEFADQAQQSIHGPQTSFILPGDSQATVDRSLPAPRRAPVPMPEELTEPRWTPANEPQVPTTTTATEDLPWAARVESTPQPAARQQVPTITLAQQIAPQPAAPTQQPTASEIIHYVKSGESLYQIAKQYYGNGEYWRAIAAHNPGKVMENGQVKQNVRLLIPNRAGLASLPDFESVQMSQPVRIDTLVSAGQSAVQLRTITVESGDTLSSLASKHLGSSTKWKQLLEANGDQLDTARDLRAGMTLKLPGVGAAPAATVTRSTAAAKPETYTVQSGDTLSSIAKRTLGDSGRWREIYDANRDKLRSPDSVVVGQKLRIPG